jgi:hypothetical protein
MKGSCATCEFFVRAGAMRNTGMCHARPPTVVWFGINAPPRLEGQLPQPITNAHWPLVGDTDWCGEFTPSTVPKLDLEKLEEFAGKG